MMHHMKEQDNMLEKKNCTKKHMHQQEKNNNTHMKNCIREKAKKRDSVEET